MTYFFQTINMFLQMCCGWRCWIFHTRKKLFSN